MIKETSEKIVKWSWVNIKKSDSPQNSIWPKVENILTNNEPNKQCACMVFNSCAKSLYDSYNKFNTGEEIITLWEWLFKIAQNLKWIMSESESLCYEDEKNISWMKNINSHNNAENVNEIFDIAKLEDKNLESILAWLRFETRVIISSLIESRCLLKWQEIDFFSKELIYIWTKIKFIESYIELKNNEKNIKIK